MHITEGILSAPILLTGTGLSLIGVTIGLQKLDYERLPQVAVLSSAFFVASLIHVPIGLSNAHLILNGLMGLILGWSVFPAILIALLLQTLLFGFGGLSVLGVNVLNMALPALLCFYLFHHKVCSHQTTQLFFYGFAAGALSIVLTTLMIGLCLFATEGAFLSIVQLIFLAHLPIMLIEGFITGVTVTFLRQVRPQLFTLTLSSSR